MRSCVFVFALIVSIFSTSFASAPAICKRSFSTYTIAPNGEVIVTVDIHKGDAKGIAKLVEEIPDGMKAFEVNSMNGTFTFEQQKVKIMWLDIPKETSFKVSYKLKQEGPVQGDYHIIGKFSYVVDDLKEEFFLSEGVVLCKEGGATTANQPVMKVVVEDVAVKTNTENVSAATTNVPVVTSEKVVEVAKVEEKVTVTTYKVQLGAFGAQKEASVFKNLGEISNEKVGEVYKYYSGNFSSKADAEKRMEEAKKSGFSGAYVVTFVDGKRSN